VYGTQPYLRRTWLCSGVGTSSRRSVETGCRGVIGPVPRPLSISWEEYIANLRRCHVEYRKDPSHSRMRRSFSAGFAARTGLGGAMQVSGNSSQGASGFATHRKRWACSLVKPPEGGWASEASRVGVGPFTGLGRNRPVVLRPVACPDRASHPGLGRCEGSIALATNTPPGTARPGGANGHAVYAQHSHPRDALVESFWLECDPGPGRRDCG
jgi:hypothetical protein